MYLQLKDVILSDGHNALRISQTTDHVRLPDGTVVQTASRSTIYAEMIRSIQRDGPLASAVALSLVLVVVALATRNLEGAIVVVAALLTGVVSMLGIASIFDLRLHYISFIAIPITLGIGCEYPFNVFDRVRLLAGDVSAAVRRTGGAVALCSYTTIVGYGSLLLSDFQALETFGRLAVVGEVACSFGALLLVPSLLHLRRGREAERIP
jgi:predicted RND superfamily exporter protein